jgi:hypothetical protein
MTPNDLTRAELYARSVAFAARSGNVRLAAALARRGQVLAGDHWGAHLARAAEPNTTRTEGRTPQR